MSIHFVTGNLFEAKADILVNPVNCLGVMGKGVAAGVKALYPECFQDYKDACDERIIHPGNVYRYAVDNPQSSVRVIYNFTTKGDWRKKSEIAWIKSGLTHLLFELEAEDDADIYSSMVMPALGCGNGKLSWEEVKPLIEETLAPLEDHLLDVYVYEPH